MKVIQGLYSKYVAETAPELFYCEGGHFYMRPELDEWMVENMHGEWWKSHWYTISFADYNDWLFFKMRWL